MTTPKFQRSILTRGNDAEADQPIAVPADDQNIYLTFGALLRKVPAEYDKVDVTTRLDRATGLMTITVQATRANTSAEYARLRQIMQDHGNAPAVDAFNAWQAELTTPLHFIADFDIPLGEYRIALVPDDKRNQPH